MNESLFLVSDSNEVTSPKLKSPGLAGSPIPMIPGMPIMREAGTKHAASMPSSSSPMRRSPPVSPRSMQRGHAHHGPGMAGDKRLTSPKGSKMMRTSSGSDARGNTRKTICISELFTFRKIVTETCTAGDTMGVRKLSK